MTVKQAVKENKMVSVILGVLATGLLAWGIWVTDASYTVHYTRSVQLSNICADIDNLELGQKEIRIELRDQRTLIATNQEKIYLLLLQIQKGVKSSK